MNVLLLEDNSRKREDVLAVLRAEVPDAVVYEAASVHSGVAAMTATIDVILLDMTMPPFDAGPDEEGTTRHFGGREFLRQIEARELLRPVIIVSQFAQFGEGETAVTLVDLSAELAEVYGPWYVGAVQYSGMAEEWKADLVAAVAVARKRGRPSA
jgi:CheY-like chemotaxis protein